MNPRFAFLLAFAAALAAPALADRPSAGCVDANGKPLVAKWDPFVRELKSFPCPPAPPAPLADASDKDSQVPERAPASVTAGADNGWLDNALPWQARFANCIRAGQSAEECKDAIGPR